MGQLDRINHVVVLMMENRSFDNMLGKLYPASSSFDGLVGTESNLDPSGIAIQVWNCPGTDRAALSIPDPDPGELWEDINEQLFETPTVPHPTPTPTMGGFVKNYLRQAQKAPGNYDAKAVMHYFSPEQVPVISQLARQFAVCDRWFASAPCQTWPNRFFVHTCTANGYENNDPPRFPYQMDTVFNQLQRAGIKNWKIYYHDLALSHSLSKLWLLPGHFRYYEEFREDARSGTLPCYSFIEPRYFSILNLPNDQHPPEVVTLGEQLIADVYNCLRSGPAWAETLLVITYDEHGGCYDHVPPPAAKPPSSGSTAPFNFDRYGVRVPAVIVSPYIAQGTVLRASGSVPYDHTSIAATLRKRFPAMGPPLSAREAQVPDLDSVLTLSAPDNLGPPSVEALPYTPSPAELAKLQFAPLKSLHKSLVHLAANLPCTLAGADFAAAVVQHIADLHRTGSRPVPPGQDAHHSVAGDFIRRQLGGFFRGL
jgi:phospholipase C